MAKAAHYLGLFLLGCVATSLIGTVATIHPIFFRLAAFIAGLALALWILAWLLDDWLIKSFTIEPMYYYGALVAIAIAILLGGGLALWIAL